jgi:hypothetical protein
MSAPVTNKAVTSNPIHVTLPDGTTMTSTHTGTIHIPGLPLSACTAHIFPALGHTSLLSIGQLCAADCTAIFNGSTATIYKDNICILQGSYSHDKLWHFPLPGAPAATPLDSDQNLSAASNFAVNRSSKPADMVAFTHASLFSPTVSTLTQAVQREYVHGFPGLTADTLARHSPLSLATAKGHLDQSRQNQQPTPPAVAPVNPSDPTDFILEPILDTDYFPQSDAPNSASHWCFAATVDATGQVYSDQTGKFIVPSSRGNNYIFLLYNYDSNSIHVEAIPNRQAATILKAYKTVFARLKAAGLQPKLARLDNECSNALKQFFQEEQVQLQLVPPYNHRRNAAERAIRTFKNHFISGLSSTDQDFPLHLWDRLLPQAELTLNLLRGSRINPRLSAHAQVFGPYHYTQHPIGPPGTQVMVHDKPAQRKTWDPHAIKAWYVAPSLIHYRCYEVWVPETQATRLTDTLSWYPQKVPLPASSSRDIIQAALDIIQYQQKHPHPATPLEPLTGTELETLLTMDSILRPHAAPASPEPAPNPPTPAPLTVPTATPPPPALPATDTPPPLVRGSPEHPILRVLPAPVTPDRPRRPNLRVPPAILRVPPAPTPPTRPTPPTPPAVSPSPPRPRPRAPRTNTSKPRRRSPRTNKSKKHSGNKKHYGTDTSHLAHLALVPPTLDITGCAFEPTCYKAIHPDTGEAVEYQSLLNSSDGHLWEECTSEEIGRLAQGYKLVKGTNTIHFIKLDAIPPDRKATYLRLVVADRPNKSNPRRVRFTVGGDQIKYPGDVSTQTAGLITAKILFNSVVSTPGAKFAAFDIKDFYLNTNMERYEYMRIPVNQIPQEIFELYNLQELVHNGGVYVEIRKGMYGLPQAGKLANDELVPHLAQHGYHQSKHIPGLFTHETRPTVFCLVVDDFGIKYLTEDDAQHLQSCLESKYKITTDYEGTSFLGMTLKWDYVNRTVDISMPGYVERALQRFGHHKPPKPEHSPHAWNKPQYGARIQFTEATDMSNPLSRSAILRLMEVIGVFLYYARCIDNTMLTALSSLSAAQSKGTEATAEACTQLLNYAATNPEATVRYRASNMILHIHSDASYHSEPQARSRVGGYFFLNGQDTANPQLNGTIHVVSKIMPNVLASAAEAEVGGLFINGQEACPIRLTLEEMGHPQPATPIITDNECAQGIANDTVKQRRSKAIDMRFYWIKDRVKQGQFVIQWQRGAHNLADYFTKHHPASHHQKLRPRYLQVLPSASAHSSHCEGVLKPRGSPLTSKSYLANTSIRELRAGQFNVHSQARLPSQTRASQ